MLCLHLNCNIKRLEVGLVDLSPAFPTLSLKYGTSQTCHRNWQLPWHFFFSGKLPEPFAMAIYNPISAAAHGNSEWEVLVFVPTTRGHEHALAQIQLQTGQCHFRQLQIPKDGAVSEIPSMSSKWLRRKVAAAQPTPPAGQAQKIEGQ